MMTAATTTIITRQITIRVYSGTFGSLGLRAGIQRYNGDSSANTGNIALDLSLPLGNWF